MRHRLAGRHADRRRRRSCGRTGRRSSRRARRGSARWACSASSRSAWPSASASSRAWRPVKGSPCEGRTSRSSGSCRSLAIEASHSPSGSASGSLRLSETLEVIRGSTWSPEIINLPASSTRQACSGEWPEPTTTRQVRAPIRSSSPSCSRTMRDRHRAHHRGEPAPALCGFRRDPLLAPAGGAPIGDAPRPAARRGCRVVSIRANSHSPRVIQSRTPNRSTSQPARPRWSGWKWVQMTRVTVRPASGPANKASQASRAGAMLRPVSTIAIAAVIVEQPEVDMVERAGHRRARPADALGQLHHRAIIGPGPAERIGQALVRIRARRPATRPAPPVPASARRGLSS